jgi:hypothetical protein
VFSPDGTRLLVSLVRSNTDGDAAVVTSPTTNRGCGC